MGIESCCSLRHSLIRKNINSSDSDLAVIRNNVDDDVSEVVAMK